MKRLTMISQTARHIYWGLVLQGMLFVALGVLIAVYPPILVVIVSISFVLIGLILFSLAWRVHTFWKRLPEFLKR
jgi:hypothetical protein